MRLRLTLATLAEVHDETLSDACGAPPSDDIHLETLVGSAPAESVESGMDSLTRSLSQLDAASLRSSQKSPAGQSGGETGCKTVAPGHGLSAPPLSPD